MSLLTLASARVRHVLTATATAEFAVLLQAVAQTGKNHLSIHMLFAAPTLT